MAIQDSSLGLALGPLEPPAPLPAPKRAPDATSASAAPLLFDIASDTPLPELPQTDLPTLEEIADDEPANGSPRRGRPGLWFAGDALMCACPDCAAPMTVRTFLMVADCWNCATSIELDETLEREARRMLADRAAKSSEGTPAAALAQHGGSASRPTSPTTRTPHDSDHQRSRPAAAAAAPPASSSPSLPARERPTPRNEGQTSSPRPPEKTTPLRRSPPSRSPSNRKRTPASVAETRRRIRRLTAASIVSAWLSGLLSMTPAWLISAVLHCVVLAILALIAVPDEDRSPHIILSTQRSTEREAGDTVHLTAEDDAQFDLPVPKEFDLSNPEVKQALLVANQEARELRVDPDALEPLRPQLAHVKKQIGSAAAHTSLAARDPRVRIEMVEREGGTTLTESAVARALRWLAGEQNDDGGWSLDQGGKSDEAATSLALLPFLGAGQTHLNGVYKNEVAGGLHWLVEHQRDDGDLRFRFRNSSNYGMYAHGQGTIVLCEAYAMEGDERLRAPAQKAVDFIVAAQHPAGGWRYRPRQEGDTSVLGWQLMALQSARVAGLTVPDATFALADQYLDSVQAKNLPANRGRRNLTFGDKQDRDFGYAYQPRARTTRTMTAEALLCRMYNGWTEQHPDLNEDITWLALNHLPDGNDPDMYYWYYGTQVFHHLGGARWERWNSRMRDILVLSQERRGRDAGSWPTRSAHDRTGGRIYTTSLAACTLEVYYRHLPVFRQIKLD